MWAMLSLNSNEVAVETEWGGAKSHGGQTLK